MHGTAVSINSSCFGYFRSLELFFQRVTQIMINKYNKNLEETQNGSEKNNQSQINKDSNTKENGVDIKKNINRERLNHVNNFEDYLCDTISDYEANYMNVINLKKMQITNCYLRFMRLAHIGNGLDIYWRKVLDIDMDISFDQYYEMIEYKTSEVLIFMIDCLCILYDVFHFYKFYILFF